VKAAHINNNVNTATIPAINCFRFNSVTSHK
jgi:hypothetical protein